MHRSPTSANTHPPLSSRTPRRNARSGAKNQHSGKRRAETRIAKSCDNCRTRKVKCDGVLPQCGACVRRRQECIYGKDARFRHSGSPAPRRRHDNTSDLLANAENSRLKSAERDHISSHPVNDASLPLFLSNPYNDQHFAQESHSNDASRIESNDINVPSYLEDSDITPSEFGTVDLENDRSAINIEGNFLRDADSEESNIQILNFLHNSYGLKSATGSFNLRKMKRATDEVRQARLIANAIVRRQQEQSILQSRRWGDNVDFDGVDPDLALHLLDLHWNTCHLTWLVTYRPAITDSLFHNGPYINRLLLNAIYYSSSLYSDRAVISSDPGDRAFIGKRFYSRFCELLRTEADQPSIPTATALILCTASLLSRGLTRDCVRLRNKTWSMVAKLECPWRSTAGEFSPGTTPLIVEIEREMRSRLYLGMAGLDTLIGLYLGQSVTGLEPYHPMIKVLDTFEELENWSYYIDPERLSDRSLQDYNPTPSYAVSTFMAQMSLYGIASDVLRFFLSHTATPATFESLWTVKATIEQQLELWSQTLPSHLHSDSDLNPKPPPHHIALLAGHHAVRILIQKAFLEGKHLSRYLNHDRHTTLKKLCADNVRIIWQLLIEYQQNFTLRRAPLLISFSAYTALMIVIDKRMTDSASAFCIESLWSMLLELRNGPNPGLQNVLDEIRKEFPSLVTNLVNASRQPEGSLIPDNNRDDMEIARPEEHRPAYSLGLGRTSSSVINSPMDGDELQISSNEDDNYEVTRFVNLCCPEDTDGFPIWMRSAIEMMKSRTLLRDALRAISKLYFGKETKNPQTTSCGQQLYTSVLGSVNHELGFPTRDTSIELLIVVILLAMIELYRPCEKSFMNQHWMASLAILESRGPLRHTTGVEHQVFTDLRYNWVVRCLRLRQATFLSREEWKVLPWQGSSSKNALQFLLDYVLEIPALLERFDQYISLAASGAISPLEDQSMKDGLFTWVDDLLSRIEEWKSTYATTYPFGSQYEPPARMVVDNNQTPLFQYLNLSTNELVTPEPLFYPNLTLAVSLCMYHTARLKLFTVRPPANHTEREEQYSDACYIGRSISYFFQHHSSVLILRIIHPLTTAYEVFKEGSVERDCIRNIFRLIGDQHLFDFFSSQVPGDGVLPAM